MGSRAQGMPVPCSVDHTLSPKAEHILLTRVWFFPTYIPLGHGRFPPSETCYSLELDKEMPQANLIYIMFLICMGNLACSKLLAPSLAFIFFHFHVLQQLLFLFSNFRKKKKFFFRISQSLIFSKFKCNRFFNLNLSSMSC